MSSSLSLTNPERENAFAAHRGKWLAIAPLTVLLLGWGIYSCNRALNRGQHQAYELAEEFHREIAHQDWAAIYAEADEGYRKAISQDDSATMFAGVVRKLGFPTSCKQGGTILNASTSGSTLTTECKTSFSLMATGQETLTWHEAGGKYRLLGYNLVSKDLLSR